MCSLSFYFVFFFNDTATTEIYTLSLHDALPILMFKQAVEYIYEVRAVIAAGTMKIEEIENEIIPKLQAEVENSNQDEIARSEEHTSELQSRQYLVCRLLLEKKKNKSIQCHTSNK